MSERRIRKVGSMDQSFIFEVDGKKNINERDNDDDSRAFVEQMILGNNPLKERRYRLCDAPRTKNHRGLREWKL